MRYLQFVIRHGWGRGPPPSLPAPFSAVHLWEGLQTAPRLVCNPWQGTDPKAIEKNFSAPMTSNRANKHKADRKNERNKRCCGVVIPVLGRPSCDVQYRCAKYGAAALFRLCLFCRHQTVCLHVVIQQARGGGLGGGRDC